MRRNKDAIQEELKRTKERLNAYLDREIEMLSPDGVQSYGIGSRNLSRYNISLGDIQTAINNLRNRVAELEAELCGQKPRKAVGVVPRDNW
jgi:hypothetical protein